MPNGRLPDEPVPRLVPDMAIDVLSISNTRAEMARKRREYSHAGVRLIWMIDPRSRTVAVYTSSESVALAKEGDIIDGGEVLPDWKVDTGRLFAELDQQAPPEDS